VGLDPATWLNAGQFEIKIRRGDYCFVVRNGEMIEGLVVFDVLVLQLEKK